MDTRFVLFDTYSWYYLFLIKVLCFTSYYLTHIPDTNYSLKKSLCFTSYLFCFISFIVNMDSSNKPFWFYLLFCIWSYMLRPNLMNYFASVRYYDLCCTAGLSGKDLKTSVGYPFILEESSSLGSASLEPIVTPWHNFMSNILKGCCPGLTQLTL